MSDKPITQAINSVEPSPPLSPSGRPITNVLLPKKPLENNHRKNNQRDHSSKNAMVPVEFPLNIPFNGIFNVPFNYLISANRAQFSYQIQTIFLQFHDILLLTSNHRINNILPGSIDRGPAKITGGSQ